MTTPTTDNPRVVTPGIETQPNQNQLPPQGVYVGLDWIRCTGEQSLRQDLRTWLDDICEIPSKETGKAQFFRHGRRWEPGVMLSWGHNSNICQVDFQGSRLRLLSGQSHIDLLRTMVDLGMKPTRLDGVLDFVNQAEDICLDAQASCERGELRQLRKYSPNNEYNANGHPTRLLLKLGARDSAVCARIYDKGLEQKIAPAGYWERVETEWKKDRAPQVANAILNAGNAWSTKLTQLILGSVDFRVSNGRTEIERQPRAEWWSRLLKLSEPAKLAPIAEDPSFDRWHEWFQTSVAPRLLQFAERTHTIPADVAACLLRNCVPKREADTVTAGFQEWYTTARLRDTQH